jgi:hypothetical protein
MIIFFSIFVYFYVDISELFEDININLKKRDRCICIITRKPSKILLDFLNDFKHYDIYIMIDDNNVNYNKYYKKKYDNINFIQIDEKICKKSGFMNVTKMTKEDHPISWDKSLYYFSNIQTNYNNVWFIEDDVYFYNEDTILNIDKKYPNSDILTDKYEEYDSKRKDYWHWKSIMNKIKIDPPYYKTMVCAVRMSKKLLECIGDYAKNHNTLFYLEAMYPTLAKRNKLKYDNPDELSTVVYRKDWKKEDINKTNLYHPIKDYDIQYLYKLYELEKKSND